jgi:hypothetical protein
MKIILILNAYILFSSYVFCQKQTAEQIIPDSILKLKKGIYMNIGEFLNNTPGISFQFELLDHNPTYDFPKKGNFISYYDLVGTRKILSLNEIWGYYNGTGIFISYGNKPYELVYLGAISILRYEKRYINKGLYIEGTPVASQHIQYVYLDLKHNKIVPLKRKFFEKLILQDTVLYEKYKNDKRINKRAKAVKYLQEYNQKHPVKITEDGIELVE